VEKFEGTVCYYKIASPYYTLFFCSFNITLTMFFTLIYNKEYNKNKLPITSTKKPIRKTCLGKLIAECVALVGYDNLERCTLRGLRSYGVTTNVAESDKLAASRHKNMSTHAHYQRSTDASRDATYKAFGAAPKPNPPRKYLLLYL